MATRKKSIPELETLKKAEESRKLAAKPATSRAPAAPVSTPKASAATHKAPARRSAPAAASIAATVDKFEVEAHRAEIEGEAYHNWLRRGAPHGSDEQDWLAAIEIVRARYAK